MQTFDAILQLCELLPAPPHPTSTWSWTPSSSSSLTWWDHWEQRGWTVACPQQDGRKPRMWRGRWRWRRWPLVFHCGWTFSKLNQGFSFHHQPVHVTANVLKPNNAFGQPEVSSFRWYCVGLQERGLPVINHNFGALSPKQPKATRFNEPHNSE